MVGTVVLILENLEVLLDRSINNRLIETPNSQLPECLEKLAVLRNLWLPYWAKYQLPTNFTKKRTSVLGQNKKIIVISHNHSLL